MFHITHIRHLESCLSKVPQVVNQQQESSGSFSTEVLKWLNELEAELEKAQLSIVSKISALRSKLILGLHKCDNGNKPTNRRKHIEYVSSNVLQEAQAIVHDSIIQKIEQIREAESIASRLIAVAFTKGVLDQLKEIQVHDQKLRYLQSFLVEDPDTKVAMTHLIGLVGIFDVLIILDQSTAGYEI